MKNYLTIGPVIILLACTAPADPTGNLSEIISDSDDTTNLVAEHFKKWSNETAPSRSEGTVSNGKLIHGRIMPFAGANFRYFDTTSYLANRAFVHEKVKKVVLKTYSNMQQLAPDRIFGLMECSNREGGKIAPHHTHQNGLSIDFMIPLIKDGRPYYGLDSLGAQHYLLEFDDTGKYLGDSSITIDFETTARHLLELIAVGKQNGVFINKVIFKLSLKDELFVSPSGKRLKQTGVYFATKLPTLINNLHDDHFHVDFQLTPN